MTVKTIETINFTPTWEGLLPALLAVIEDGNAVGRANAIEELTRMARAADVAVAMSKQRPGAPGDQPEDQRTGEQAHADTVQAAADKARALQRPL